MDFKKNVIDEVRSILMDDQKAIDQQQIRDRVYDGIILIQQLREFCDKHGIAITMSILNDLEEGEKRRKETVSI